MFKFYISMRNSHGQIRRRTGFVIILLTFLIISVFWYFGLIHVFDAYNIIRNLSQVDKEKAYNMLGTESSSQNYTGGLLLRLNSKNNSLKGFWLWNINGIKYYDTKYRVSYGSFNVCGNRDWAQSSAVITKNVNMDYGDWMSNLRPGDYVQLQLSEAGSVQNITSYDYWVFASPLPYSYFELKCQKR